MPAQASSPEPQDEPSTQVDAGAAPVADTGLDVQPAAKPDQEPEPSESIEDESDPQVDDDKETPVPPASEHAE
jgi:hypothetical protein